MIYEMRTYTFHLGKLPAYLELARNVGRPVRGQNYGTNHGYWTSEFGPLNQIWHLWSYPSLDERKRLQGELAKNERWTKEYSANVRPLIARQDIRFLNPVNGVNPPAKEGGFYELRMYRTQPWPSRRVGGSVPRHHAGAGEIFSKYRHLDRRGTAAERSLAYVELSGHQRTHDGPGCLVQGPGMAGLSGEELWRGCRNEQRNADPNRLLRLEIGVP